MKNGTQKQAQFWDRDELLETVKEAYQQLHGERPQPGLYDDLEIKALEGELKRNSKATSSKKRQVLMCDLTIYHNPRCSKSRQTLELIRSKGVEPEIVLYLEDVPSANDIEDALRMLGMKPMDIIEEE